MEISKRYILLVDDNRDDVELTILALEQNQIDNEVKVARNGEEALAILFPKNGNVTNLPAVILLDLNMPKVSGLEVLGEIRKHERTRRLPVVILTSSLEERDIINGYNLGANSYIRKPVDFDNFVHAIKHLGLYWLVLNELPAEAASHR